MQQLLKLMEKMNNEVERGRALLEDLTLVDKAIFDVNEKNNDIVSHITFLGTLNGDKLYSDSLVDTFHQSELYHTSLERMHSALEQKRSTILRQLIITKERIKEYSKIIKDIQVQSFSEVSSSITQADKIIESVNVIESKFVWSDCDVSFN